MFEIGWSELVVVAVVAILVVGPKELPGMLRTVGKTIGNLRRMAGDFQRQFDQALKEAELDEVRKQVQAPFQPLEDARKSAEAFQKKVSESVRELEGETEESDSLPTTPSTPAASAVAPAPTPAAPLAAATAVAANGSASPPKPADHAPVQAQGQPKDLEAARQHDRPASTGTQG